MHHRVLDEEHPYSEGDDLKLEYKDPVLSEPTLANFEITRPIPEYRHTYEVIKTNDCEEYLVNGKRDPGQMMVYPGETCVRKAVPISIFGQSVFYDRDDYFLESKCPQLSEATIDKFKYKECIYVKKLGVIEGEERSEGFVPRRCLQAVDSENCKFIFMGVTLEDRLYGGPKVCLP